MANRGGLQNRVISTIGSIFIAIFFTDNDLARISVVVVLAALFLVAIAHKATLYDLILYLAMALLSG